MCVAIVGVLREVNLRPFLGPSLSRVRSCVQRKTYRALVISLRKDYLSFRSRKKRSPSSSIPIDFSLSFSLSLSLLQGSLPRRPFSIS